MARTTTKKPRARDDRHKLTQLERDIKAELDDEHAEELARAAQECDDEQQAYDDMIADDVRRYMERSKHESMECEPSCSLCAARREKEDAQSPSGIEEYLDLQDALRLAGEG